MDVTRDYYAILDIEPSADAEEIRKAYRRLVREHHPDTRNAPAGTTLLFRQLQEAYEVLGDPAQRAAYDQARAEAGLSPEAAVRWKFVTNRQIYPVLPDEQAIYVMLEVAAAKQVSTQERLPMNLCLVLDRSTSMQGQRLDQVKAATYRLIENLTARDYLSIVAFSDRAEVIVPSQAASDPVRLKSKMAALQAGGSTEILQGMMAGLRELGKYCSGQAVNHMLLLTDGQTYGDEEGCLMHASEAKKRDISISCLGLGEDWNDTLLDAIANRSGGISAYISAVADVPTFFQERLHGLSATYAQDVKLIVRCAEGCALKSVYKLSPYLLQLNLEGDAFLLGALEVDRLLPVVMEFVIAPRPAGQHRLAQFELRAKVAALKKAQERLRRDLTLTFSSNPPDEAPPPALFGGLAKIAIFKMQDKALKSLEAGNVTESTHRLEMVATRLLDLGEQQLARATLLEAGRLARSGQLSPAGRKAIKYGTRSLTFSPTKELVK